MDVPKDVERSCQRLQLTDEIVTGDRFPIEHAIPQVTRVAKPVGELPHVRDPVLKIIAGCVNECA